MHTPGPWTLVNKDNSIVGKYGESVCRDGSGAFVAIVNDDDARLIAAAPELLEAAKLVLAWYDAENDHSKADFYQRMKMCQDSEESVRAAIAKATGEQ